MDLDLRGLPVDRAVTGALQWLRARGWSGLVRARWEPTDPGSRAAAGLLRVALAEEGPALRVQLLPSLRLVPVEELREPVRRLLPPVARGPWSARLAAAWPSAPAPGAPAVWAPEPPADGPIRSLDPARAGGEVATALASLEGAPGLAVCPADDLLGRPFSAASAAVAGAVGALAEARGVPLIALGPTADASAPRHLGFAPWSGEGLRAVLASIPGGQAPLVAADVDWPAAVAAFPHLRELAPGLPSAGPTRPWEVLDAVRDEIARIAGGPRAPARIPVRELGLDSVGGSQLRVELERRFGVSLPATLVFEHPTAESIAGRIVAALAEGSRGGR